MSKEKIEENKIKLRDLIENLSMETVKDLDILLSAVIPIGEVVGSNYFKFSALPLSNYGFDKKGLDEDRVRWLINAIASETDDYEKELLVENDKLVITLEGVEMLKYVKEAVIEKLKQKKPESPSKFSDEKAQLEVDGFVIQLPPYKNGHAFCRVMFMYEVNEPVDWDIIYEEIAGINKLTPYGSERKKIEDQNKHTVSDTMRSINDRLAQNGSLPLFMRSDNTYRRLR